MSIYHVPTHRQRTKSRPHNSVAWQKASAAWLQQYPFCVLCLVRGRVNECALNDTCTRQRRLVVDHIEPHRGNMDLFWDQNNWETLCRMCHDVEKQRHERAGKTVEQWVTLLREEMHRTGSRESVRGMAAWLPEAIRIRM